MPYRTTFMAVVAAVLFPLVPRLATAQETHVPEPFGRIFSARVSTVEVGGLRSVNERLKDAQKTETHKFLFIPVVADVPDAFVSGAAVGYRNLSSDAHPWLLRVGYSNVALHGEEPADINSFMSNLKVQVHRGDRYVLTGVGDYRLAHRTSNALQSLAALEVSLTDRLTLAGNGGWGFRKPRTGESTSDFLAGAGLSLAVSKNLELSADYSIKNDLDGESDYSFSATYGLGEATLSASVGKHGAVSFALITQF